jgi:hypothetical protein
MLFRPVVWTRRSVLRPMHMAAVVGVLPGMAREPKGFASRLAWLLVTLKELMDATTAQPRRCGNLSAR